MRTSTAVDATLISAPSSTKNADGQRAPEMKQTEKGNNWHFSMKTRIGVEAQSGLVRTVAGTAANVNNLNVAGSLHGEEGAAIGDAGYQDVNKRPDAAGPAWHVAMRAGLRKKLNPFFEPDFVAVLQISPKYTHGCLARTTTSAPTCLVPRWPRPQTP
ncbi:transposase [Stenotrophomonas maltophilia]|nr:transposase [Stenotrophomonas maltophilia]